jgi:trk system potassium uptake protein TrkA
VTEVVLDEEDPAVGQRLADLSLPPQSLISAIIRGQEALVPDGESRLQVADRLIVIALPENQEVILRTLTGKGD